MEQFFVGLFGVENHITTAQEAARAVLIFSYGLVLLRISGPRMFGHWSALDIVMVEVSTAAGITGWGDAFGYVCPRTTLTAVNADVSGPLIDRLDLAIEVPSVSADALAMSCAPPAGESSAQFSSTSS